MNDSDTNTKNNTDEKPDADDAYLEIEEVARIIKCSTRHVRHLMERRKISYAKDGSNLRFKREEVHAYMTKHTIHARD